MSDLPNRNVFEKRLRTLWINTQENGHEHVLAHLDLDQFKVINEAAGHLAGDQLLREVFHLRQRQFRSGASIARLSVYEFAVVLEHCNSGRECFKHRHHTQRKRERLIKMCILAKTLKSFFAWTTSLVSSFLLRGFCLQLSCYDLAIRVDHWVVENRFAWMDRTPGAIRSQDTCAINLSGQSLGNDRFLTFMIDRMKHYQIKAERLCFEVTETASIARLKNALIIMKTLKLRGCRFALDDFGSGLSSFGYLKNLPVDF